MAQALLGGRGGSELPPHGQMTTRPGHGTGARGGPSGERAPPTWTDGACQPVWDGSAGKLLRRLRWVEGLVDPHLPGKLEGLGWLADEPLGMGGVGAVQDHGAGVDDLLGAAVV